MREKFFSAKNSILALLTFMLVICLTLGLGLTVRAEADEAEPDVYFTIGADADDTGNNTYASFADGWNAAVAYSCENSSALVQVTLASNWEAKNSNDYITSFGEGAGFSYGRIIVPADANIFLDLNGNNIDRKICDENGETPETAALDRVTVEELNEEDLLTRQGNVIHVAGKLEISDTAEEGGKICGGYGSFLINGNKTEYSQRGGGVSVVADGELVLSGNAVISGNIARWGGGVYIDPYAKFTMSGGVIENNYSTQGGGGVLVSGKFTMSGGVVKGNQATTNGGGVYVNALPSEEFLREDNSLLCIFTMSGGSIEGNTANTHGGGVTNSYIFEMSGGSIEGNTAMSHAGGVYNLAAGTITMAAGTITGNTATSNGGGIYNAGALELTGGSITGNTAKTSSGGGVCNAGTFEMADGSIDGNTANTHGGGVYNNTSGKFTMAGGSITGNTASSNGGGVYNYTSATFTMKGGQIGSVSDSNEKTGNTANNGGGIFNNTSGTFTMADGSIIGNKSNSGGGGVYNNTSGIFTMNDGLIDGNEATTSGGGVSNVGTFTMVGGIIGTISDDDSIDGNTAKNGGGVYNSNSIIIEGGSIVRNSASAHGGGIYNTGSITIADGSIDGNKATSNGGGIYSTNSVTMSGGTITGNKASTHGGGVFNHTAGTFTMEGGIIGTVSADGSTDGNTASSHGGGVYNNGSLKINAGTLSGNTATSNGGGVYNNTNSSLEMTGGSIIGNTAKTVGGVYNNNSGNTIKLSGTAVIKENITKTATSTSTGNLHLLAGQNLTVGELTEGAYIGVKAASLNAGLSTSDVNYASLKYMYNDTANNYLALNADGQLISVTQYNDWSLNVNGEEIETDVPGYTYTYGEYGKDNVITIKYGAEDAILYKVGEGGGTQLTVSSSYELTAGTYYALNSDRTLRFNIIIEKLELDEENLKIEGLPTEETEVEYTGEAYNPLPATLLIKLGNGEEVVPNYSISYNNNVNAGTATLILKIVGTENYEGCTIIREFTITPSETAYEVEWLYLNESGEWEVISDNALSVTFNNTNYLNNIYARLTAGGSEIDVYGSSTGLKLTASGDIIAADSYTVSITGSGNYTVPNSVLNVTVEQLDFSGLDESSFTGEDAQTRRLWLLHIGDTASQLRSSATYFADGEVITGTEEYYYARYRKDADLSIALNDVYSVTFAVGNTSKTYTIAQLATLGVKVTYSDDKVTCIEDYENTLHTITTTVTLSFDGNDISGSDITITKEWAIVTINNGLLNSDGVEYSISDYTWGGSGSITEAPVPEHGNAASFKLQKGEIIITEFTVRYNADGSQSLSGEDVADESESFAEFVNEFITSCGTYRLTVELFETEGDDGEVYYPVVRTFQFTVNPYTLTAAEVSLSVSAFTYNGGAIEPNIVYPAGATIIREYSNNINVGTATVIVTGTGNYTGSVELTFTIGKATENEIILDAHGWTYGNYSASEVYFSATANYGTIEYTVKDANGNIVSDLSKAVAGTYTVEAVVIGSSNYDGTEVKTASFVIAKAGHVWEETPSIMSWVKGEYNANENGVMFTDIFGNTVASENVNILIYDANLDESDINDNNVIYKVVNGEVVIDKLAKADVGHYTLKVTINETDNYFGAEKTFNFQIFAPEGLAWWAWLLIIVGILGVIALVFFILHEKGVLQMLTGKFVIAMRTKMTVDATIAAVRANMVAERSAKTRAEAQKRDRIDEMRKAREEAKQRPADEQAAALEEQAALAAKRAEKMQKRAASMQKRADKMRAKAGEAEAEQEATATDEPDSTEE